ncbi:MAG: two-component system sensor histidine kinase NtrB, partial [Candidatus Latescibacterota bacterium]
KTPENDDRKEYVSLILAEVARLGRIVDDLLHFARPRESRYEQIDANRIIEDVLLLHSEDFTARRITVRKRLSKLPPIRADRDKFTQVIVNVILNARDAMPEGGELLVTSGGITRERDRRGIAIFQFRDTGQGIPEDVLAHVFEPFFTTKPSGVGLGLAICKAIIEEHGGMVSIVTDRDGNSQYRTVVSLEIPITEEKQPAE